MKKFSLAVILLFVVSACNDRSASSSQTQAPSPQTEASSEEVTPTGTTGEEAPPTGSTGEEVMQNGTTGEEVTQNGTTGEEVTPTGSSGEEVMPTGTSGKELTPTRTTTAEVAQTGTTTAEGAQTGTTTAEGAQTGTAEVIQTGTSSEEAKPPTQPELTDAAQVESAPSLVESTSVDKSNPRWKQSLDQPALMSFEEGKTYYWDLHTNKGTMSFRLFHDSAPMHATSTIYLTRLGFYDDVIFHRVIPGFMAQGGDPTGTGKGGPGYKYAGEFDGTTSHDRPGLLSMANSGAGTDGSQFFITFVKTPFLDGKHTIFGALVSGEETLSELEKLGSRSGKTSELLQINKATIRVE